MSNWEHNSAIIDSHRTRCRKEYIRCLNEGDTNGALRALIDCNEGDWGCRLETDPKTQTVSIIQLEGIKRA